MRETDLSGDYEYIGKVVLSGVGVVEGMAALTAYCNQHRPSPVWERVRQLDYLADVERLARWLTNVLTHEPPVDGIKGFWFGLFNPSSVVDGTWCDLYLSGTSAFDIENDSTDWDNEAAKAGYMPVGRYGDSQILKAIFALTMARRANNSQAGIESPMGEYVLCLGYAALAVTHLCQTLPADLLLGKRSQRIASVGFDSGDYWVLGVVRRSGWHFYGDEYRHYRFD